MAALAPARVRPADTFVTLVDDTDLIAVIPDGDRPECVLQLRLSATEITGGWAINDIPWDYVDTIGPHALRVDRLAHQDPAAFQQAAAWLEQQLRRPLELRQWCWSDRVVGRELVLGDSGMILDRSGLWWLRWLLPGRIKRQVRPAGWFDADDG